MDLTKVFDKAVFVTPDEKDQLCQEGYDIEVADIISDRVYRIHLREEDYLDVLMGLSFIRSVTKGFGNIHMMDLFGANPSVIVSREITYGGLIKLHHKALERELKFAGIYEDSKLTVHFRDDYMNTVIEVLQ